VPSTVDRQCSTASSHADRGRSEEAP
jgi:hypothetical protein